jgi:outer membrane immunogenic protein
MGLLAFGASANAHDWTGLYLGANIGWGQLDSDVSNSVPCTTNCTYFVTANAVDFNARGSFDLSDDVLLGGVQTGYNFQTGALVYGIEGDVDFLNGDASRTIDIKYVTALGAGNFVTNKIEMDYLATLRGRIGLASGPFLFYATGGLALTDLKLSSLVQEHTGAGVVGCPTCGTGTSSTSETVYGWTVGGGAEWALTSNWSLKGEYLFADFGDVHATSTGYLGSEFIPQDFDHSADLTVQTARVGINYKF